MGIPLSPRAVIPGEFNENSGYQRMKALLKRGVLPTALVAASDLAAIGAMRALAEAGVEVPNEVSVMGFGDFQVARYTHPSLSTVRLPLYELGTESAEALITELQNAPVRTFSSKLLPCELVLRDSTAPPRRQD